MAKIDEKFMKADRSIAKKMGNKIEKPTKKSGTGSGTKSKKKK